MPYGRLPTVMTIAGSDSGAGAGIQADLKTFAAFGVYGTSAITAVTAQNTQGVYGVAELPPAMVAQQIDAIVRDIGADAVKTGMLANAAIIEVVAAKVREHSLPNLVVDPVMVAKGGDSLLRQDAIAAMRDVLVPLATVVTPNLPEAEALVGRKLPSDDDIHEAARQILATGCRAVVMKGGHRTDTQRMVDLLYDGQQFQEFVGPRIETANTHGTGCTLASAIAAGLAKGESIAEAVGAAKEYLTEALRHAYAIGSGHGPVHHFYRWWKE